MLCLFETLFTKICHEPNLLSMARVKPTKQKTNNGANVGYEAELWQMADALRGSMDAAEYKHVVLGLIFLKYISDAFEEQHTHLEAEKAHGADPEDPDEYRGAAHPVFWVPPEARWPHLKAQAKQSTVGQLVDDAMAGIERDNPALKGVLPKDYARPGLDKARLGQLINLVSDIALGAPDSDEEAVRQAAEIAGLADDIEDFPKKYDTLVGERGITLSGGQKQRAALARAVLRNPRILILDDALSSVDTQTEEKILRRLTAVMRERTTLLISHRVSTVRHADQIVVLKDGRVVERGTHGELLARGGYYYDLYQKQLLEEELERA